MPFCANCGISVADSDGFCKQCGAPSAQAVNPPSTPPPQYSFQQSSPVQATSASRVIAILPQAKMMTPVGLSDIYTIVFTPSQAIFAKLTGEILTDAVKKSQAQGKASGKGWLGRANDQMRAKGAAHMRYLDMAPGQILAETPGNFEFDHVAVASVGIKVVYEYTNQDVPGDPSTEIVFDTASGSLKFLLRKPVKEVAETLNNFYPGRVKG